MKEPFRAVVIGAGGVGSWLCQGLARQLEYSAPGSGLVIVDGDTFEPKNAERQVFNGAGNKATVLAADLSPQFPRSIIIPLPAWVVENVEEGNDTEEQEDGTVVSKVTARNLLQDGDVVYAVVDNDACRKILIDAASKLDNVDLFTAGNDENYYGSVYHYRRRDGRDVTVNPLENHPEYEAPNDRNPGDLSCQERAEIEGGTQLVATNMAVASFLLGRTHKMILSDGEFIHDEETGDGDVEIFFDLGVGRALGSGRLAVQQTQLQEV